MCVSLSGDKDDPDRSDLYSIHARRVDQRARGARSSTSPARPVTRDCGKADPPEYSKLGGRKLERTSSEQDGCRLRPRSGELPHGMRRGSRT
eukprot:3143012-Heterocapsa_arctica.AAC.1